MALLRSTRSLIVTQRVHLKTLSPLGHRDSAPQVMQLPEACSLSPSGGLVYDGPGACGAALDLEPGPSPSISASESESESKSSSILVLPCEPLLVGKREGNGLLIDRPWLDDLGGGGGRCTTVEEGRVGMRSEGIWEASIKLGSTLGREGAEADDEEGAAVLGTGLRGICLKSLRRGWKLSSEGRGCSVGGNGASLCGGRGIPSGRVVDQGGDAIVGS